MSTNDETLITSIASGLAALLVRETLRKGKAVEIHGIGKIVPASTSYNEEQKYSWQMATYRPSNFPLTK